MSAVSKYNHVLFTEKWAATVPSTNVRSHAHSLRYNHNSKHTHKYQINVMFCVQ